MLNTGSVYERWVRRGVLTRGKTIQRMSLLTIKRGLLDTSGSRLCPRKRLRSPQRRSSVSSMTKGSSLPSDQGPHQHVQQTATCV